MVISLLVRRPIMATSCGGINTALALRRRRAAAPPAVEFDEPHPSVHPDTVEVDAKKVAALCARLGIRRLSVFGSVARGEERPDSDIDLLAEFSERVTLLDLVRAERELADELGRRVDLLTPAALSPHLRDRIESEARVLYERAG